MQSCKTALSAFFFFCCLVKLLIYIPEWHKREGEALFQSHLSARRRCAARCDRMRPNNSKPRDLFFFGALNLTISQRCYFHAGVRQFAEGGKHESCEASSKSTFARLIIFFNAALNYCFLLPFVVLICLNFASASPLPRIALSSLRVAVTIAGKELSRC